MQPQPASALPPWWPIYAGVITTLGLLIAIGGMVGVGVGNRNGWLAMLTGLYVAALPWTNGMARQAIHPSGLTAATAQVLARRLRLLAGLFLLLTAAAALVAATVGAASRPGGELFVVSCWMLTVPFAATAAIAVTASRRVHQQR
jgi:hypothetical protein